MLQQLRDPSLIECGAHAVQVQVGAGKCTRCPARAPEKTERESCGPDARYRIGYFPKSIPSGSAGLYIRLYKIMQLTPTNTVKFGALGTAFKV